MSVRARYNDWLNHSWAQDGDAYFKSTPLKANGTADGSVTYGQGTMFGGNCSRTGHTKNPSKLISGVRFRPPSTYSRQMLNVRNASHGVWREEKAAGAYTLHEGAFPYAGPGDFQTILQGSGWDPGTCYYNWAANETDRAITECLNKLSEAKVNLGQNLAEAKQSYGMMVDQATRMLYALRSVKHGNYKLAAKHLGLTSSRGIASNILAIQLGWKPLMTDIYDSAQLLMNGISKPLTLRVAREIKVHHNYEANFPSARWRERRVSTRATYKCILHAKVKDSFIHQAQGFGLVNPLSLAWELVPYSFVVDWVMPIGNVIDALSAPAGLDFIGGCQVRTAEMRGSAVLGNLSLTALKVQSPQVVEAEAYCMRRQQFTGWPRPAPYIKSPFSTNRALTAMALLRQLF